ncbi:MAG: sugar phosphate isomerase/epimerase family protein [Spirochaetia bacterium]
MEKFGFQKAIQLLSDIGYDCLDLSLFSKKGKLLLDDPGYQEKAHKLKKIADDAGISFNQSHTPFPCYIPGDEEYNRTTYLYQLRSLEISSIVGAKYVVIHPTALEKDQISFNREYYSRLADYSLNFYTRIAVENMFAWDKEKDHAVANVCSRGEDFLLFMEEMKIENLVACVDVGHAPLVGDTASSIIETLGSRYVKSLHIHDNDEHSDMHTLPFLQSADWRRIMGALKNIGYTGELTLEADRFLLGFPDDMLPAAGEFMLKTARRLAKMFEESGF